MGEGRGEGFLVLHRSHLIHPTSRMKTIRHIEQAVLRSRRLPASVIGLALVVLAGVVAFATLQARQRIRAQMAGRDSEVLYAVALWHYGEDVKEGMAGRDSEVLYAVALW